MKQKRLTFILTVLLSMVGMTVLAEESGNETITADYDDTLPAADYKRVLTAAETLISGDILNAIAEQAATDGKTTYGVTLGIPAGATVDLHSVDSEGYNSNLKIPDGMSITFFGMAGGDAPTIKFQKNIDMEGTHGYIAFENVVIVDDGAKYVINQSKACNVGEFRVKDSEISGFANAFFRLQGTDVKVISKLVLDNSIFHDMCSGYSFIHVDAGSGKGVVNNIDIDNCTLYNIATGGKMFIYSKNTNMESITVSNTTFYNCIGNNNYWVDFGANTYGCSVGIEFEKCLFTKTPDEVTKNNRSSNTVSFIDCWKTTDFFKAFDCNAYESTADDIFTNPANGDFTLKISDKVGDPRWRIENNNKPYAVLSDSSKVLTFYYDNQKEARGGMDVGPFSIPGDRGWESVAASVTTVLFDQSFANCTSITSTAFWFYGMQQLQTLDLSYLTMTNVTNTSGMFTNCSSLATITVNNTWPAKEGSNVTGSDMFNGCRSLKGGAGTTYDGQHVDYTYAHIDGGESNPGYFTDKNAPVVQVAAPTFSQSGNQVTMSTATEGATIHYTLSEESHEKTMDLTNGDFESWTDGEPNGWKSASTASNATLTQSTDAHSGSFSCNVNGDASVNKRLASQEMTLPAGTYTFSFWAKATTEEKSQARPGYVPIIDGSAGTYTYGEYVNLSTTWQQISYTFTLDAETTVCLLVMNPKTSDYSSGKDILVDDATLTSKETVEHIYSSPLTLTTDCTITAWATRDGYTDSEKTQYEFRAGTDPVDQVATPTFALNGEQLSITTETEGATIYYTVQEYSNLPQGDGSEANPFNVAAAIVKCKETGETATAEKYYIKGIVVSGAKADAPYGNITFQMGDSNAEGANTFYSYRVYGPDSTKLAEDYEVKVGEEVVVYGSLINYRSSTPETVQGAYLISKATPELTSRYGGPIQVSGNTIVRAKATKDGMSDSDIAMMSTAAAANPEPYAVLSDNNTVLTFYYDDQKTAKNGMDVGPFDYYSKERRGWSPYTSQITKAVFDQSFDQCTTLTSTAFWFTYMTQLETIEHIEYLHTDNVEDMNCMFDSCYVLRDLDVSHFVTAKVTNMQCMFNRCEALTSLNLSNFNTSSCTFMRGMFYDCKGLTRLDLTNFDTSKNTSTESMFELCSSLESITFGSGFSTENVTSMGWMFDYCSALTSLDVSSFNTANVTSMRSMFSGCEKLTNLDVSNFNTEKVTDMRAMFNKCSSLTTLNVSSFNTGNVTDMSSMFMSCMGLTTLDLSSFNTQNVTNMSGMFLVCTSLTSLDVSGFNTQQVTNMQDMFRACTNLTSLDLSRFNTQNVAEMYGMFYNCTNLKSLDLSNFDTRNVRNMDHLFRFCTNLVNLNISGFNTANGAFQRNMFEGCSSLASIQAGNAVIADSTYAQIQNPNLLLYVNEASQAPQSVRNVVVLDAAEQIVLTDMAQGNNNFYCPKQFRAKSINYTRNFKQTTQVGVSRGWETIALPFAVQTITHEKNGTLTPFGVEGGKPFWLKELTENGLVSAQRIDAYVPYLISMPNNSIYPDDYNQAGQVTFSATNAVVPVTESRETSGNNRTLIPTMMSVAQSPDIYVINRDTTYQNNPQGSIFVADYREVRPFEAYVKHVGGARYFSLSEIPQLDVTGIESIELQPWKGEQWWTLDGRKLNRRPSKKGIYIRNGKKVVVDATF